MCHTEHHVAHSVSRIDSQIRATFALFLWNAPCLQKINNSGEQRKSKAGPKLWRGHIQSYYVYHEPLHFPHRFPELKETITLFFMLIVVICLFLFRENEKETKYSAYHVLGPVGPYSGQD